ncbi:MAG: FAD:protein FMN transferase [Gemmatimonadetes bacterium]|nr:FAD:protein FMN transferase [Gemmatimonadota bacterium]
MTQHNDSRGPSRRDFLALGAGAFVVSTFGIGVARRRIVRRTVPVMGTTAELMVVTRDDRAGHSALTAATDELRAVERLMTRFRADSDIGRVNAAPPGTAVAVAAPTAAVVSEALRWAGAAGGSFDPALGRATQLWNVTHRSAPPELTDVQRLAGRGLYRQIEIDGHRGGHVIVLRDPDVAIDLGGIAKGYGVDRAVAALREWGITDGLVNVGGDLYALGSSLDDEGWSVGIRSATDPSRLAGTMVLRDRAVATSGDYEQFFEHGGRRYHHLLDPATGAPRTTAGHSLTVMAATCMTADAAATAVFGCPHGSAGDVLRGVAADAELVTLA